MQYRAGFLVASDRKSTDFEKSPLFHHDGTVQIHIQRSGIHALLKIGISRKVCGKRLIGAHLSLFQDFRSQMHGVLRRTVAGLPAVRRPSNQRGIPAGIAKFQSADREPDFSEHP